MVVVVLVAGVGLVPRVQEVASGRDVAPRGRGVLLGEIHTRVRTEREGGGGGSEASRGRRGCVAPCVETHTKAAPGRERERPAARRHDREDRRSAGSEAGGKADSSLSRAREAGGEAAVSDLARVRVRVRVNARI